TAIRSSTTPLFRDQTDVSIRTACRISERLPNREKELEMADALFCGRAIAGRARSSYRGVAFEQIRRGPAEPEKGRRVDAICEVEANRSNRCPISHAESD